MADVKISALPAAAGVSGDDLLVKVDDPAGAPVTEKMTVNQLTAHISAASIQVSQGVAPGPPLDPNKAALDYPLGGGGLQQWDVASQTWV